MVCPKLKKASARKSFSNQPDVLWDENQAAECGASVYGGFPAIASLTAGEQLHLQTLICSPLSLNNGGQLQEEAAGEEAVATSPPRFRLHVTDVCRRSKPPCSQRAHSGVCFVFLSVM